MRDVLVYDDDGNRAIVTNAVYFPDARGKGELEFGDSHGAIKIPEEVLNDLASTELCMLIEEAKHAIRPVALESKIAQWKSNDLGLPEQYIQSIVDLALELTDREWDLLTEEAKKDVANAYRGLRDDQEFNNKVSRDKTESPPQPSPDPGYVYLAKAETGEYKIGHSIKPVKRVKHFDTQMPIDVDIIHHFEADHPRKAESILHDQYDEFRKTGEWFSLPQQEASAIKSISEYVDGEFVFDSGSN